MAFPLIPLAIGVIGGLAKRMRRNRQLRQQQSAMQEEGAFSGTATTTTTTTPQASRLPFWNAAQNQTTPTSGLSDAATGPNTAQTAAGAANTGGTATTQFMGTTGNALPSGQQQGGVTPVAQPATQQIQQGQGAGSGGMSAAAMGVASKERTRKKNLAQQAALNARSNI